MTIIDAQVHVWCEESAERPWPAEGRSRAHVKPPITYENLLARMAEAGVDRAVLVPPSWQGDSVDYCLEAATAHPTRFGVMGRLGLHDPAARTGIEHWMQRPGMLGIRLTFHQPQNRAWMLDGTADWVWPVAERLGIPIMVHAPHPRPQLGEVAARHPRLRLVLDHMGLGRETRNERFGSDIAETLALARHPNIAVKLTMVPYFSTEPFPYRNLHDGLRRLVEAFGARRCFWGTDLSLILSTTDCSYRDAVRLFTEKLDFLSGDDQSWIMGRGLAEWLGWRVEQNG